MAETKFGTFEDLLAIANDDMQPIIVKLKEVINQIDPAACQVVRLGDRAATYGVGPKKMIEGYVYILPHKAWVNLGFYRGTTLNDPNKLLEGTGKNLRHIKIRSVADAERNEIKDLIIEALNERKSALGV